MKKEKDVILHLETPGEKGDEINRGLLTEGDRLAGLLGGGLFAVIVGDDSPIDLELFGKSGVSVLYQVKGNRLSPYCAEVHAWVLKQVLKEIPCRLVLFANSDRGSDLAPRVAASLDTAAVTGCADICAENGTLTYVRLVYGGQFSQEVAFADSGTEVATIAPEVLNIQDGTHSGRVRTVDISVEVPSEITGPMSLGLIAPDYRTVDILYAKRIVGAGAGCADPRLMRLVEELSDLLEGSVATTRPVVDDGYLPKERMIGQTGKTVVPDLYLALGISGSPHHVAGIQQTKRILSVNRDPRAPVFDVSDKGFVGDLDSLLPKLIDRIKRYRDEGSV
jgi:electron transfer flavoprotein alpha subunit